MKFLRLFILSGCVALTACAHAPKKDRGPNPYYDLVLSNLMAFDGDVEGSIKNLLKSVEAYPDNAHLKYLAAQRFAEAQNWVKASQYINEALKIKPKWSAAKILKGQILEAQGELDKAGVIFSELLKSRPKKEESYFNLSQNLVHRQKYNQAIQVLNSWIAKNPDSVTTLYYIATIQNVYLKDSAQALKSYSRLLQLDPDDIRVRNQVAQIYLKQNNKEKALEEFINIERQFPNDLSIKVQIASLYQDIGRVGEAITKLNEILEINPQADRIHYFLGLLYEKLKEEKKALEHFEKITATSSVFDDAVLQQAVLLRDLKESKRGTELLRNAIRKHPKVSRFYQFLSLFWEEEEQMDRAVDALKDGIKKIPNDEELYFNLGSLHDKLKQKEESLKMMRKVLELNPKNAAALNYIGYTYAEAGDKLDEAEKLIVEALKIKPGDAYITDSLGWVYYQKGDLKKALIFIEKANKRSPNEPVILEHLGDVYLKRGEKSRAKQFFKQAIEQGRKKEKPNGEEIDRVEEKLKGL